MNDGAQQQHCVVYCTCPDSDSAGRIAHALVGERLAACVNLLPGIKSIYKWKGEIAQETEVLLLIKTRRVLIPRLIGAIRPLHPYELPEVISVPITDGLPDYLQWIDNELESAV